jgi:DNA repair photolyase
MTAGRDRPLAKGRGAQIDPPNRFERTHRESDLEHVEHDEDYLNSLRDRPTEFLPDRFRSVITENDSPDVGFRFSLNPYRGCSHGCSYCYARPYHEYLGFSAGLDFETKILVKEDAPDLFRDFLRKPGWVPEPIAFSGITDPYQQAERQFELTRKCLEIALECRQPISFITKSSLIRRDLDLFKSLAEQKLVHVNISVTTLDDALARDLEPRASLPESRLRAIADLAGAGVPVRVMVAPIIPGLTEEEIPAILKAAKVAGARQAGMTLLRLPLSVAPVFTDWIQRKRPDRAGKVLQRVRQIHQGKLNTTEFGKRMTGAGELSEQIRKIFHVFRIKSGLDQPMPPYEVDRFRPPLPTTGQLLLF